MAARLKDRWWDQWCHGATVVSKCKKGSVFRLLLEAVLLLPGMKINLPVKGMAWFHFVAVLQAPYDHRKSTWPLGFPQANAKNFTVFFTPSQKPKLEFPPPESASQSASPSTNYQSSILNSSWFCRTPSPPHYSKSTPPTGFHSQQKSLKSTAVKSHSKSTTGSTLSKTSSHYSSKATPALPPSHLHLQTSLSFSFSFSLNSTAVFLLQGCTCPYAVFWSFSCRASSLSSCSRVVRADYAGIALASLVSYPSQ